MTDKILNHFKSKISSLALSPYADGRFEVFLGDKLVYSKLETGEFPDEGVIIEKLEDG